MTDAYGAEYENGAERTVSIVTQSGPIIPWKPFDVLREQRPGMPGTFSTVPVIPPFQKKPVWRLCRRPVQERTRRSSSATMKVSAIARNQFPSPSCRTIMRAAGAAGMRQHSSGSFRHVIRRRGRHADPSSKRDCQVCLPYFAYWLEPNTAPLGAVWLGVRRAFRKDRKIRNGAARSHIFR